MKCYTAFCGKKIPEGWSRLCYSVSSWKHRKWWWWRTTAQGVHVNTVTHPAVSSCLRLALADAPAVLMLTSPWTGLCTSVLYRKFVDHLPLCKDGLVTYCTVLDSTAPVKNQPPWKAAKKFQQCESRNKLGTSITIAAIARISPTIFPPMCELFSAHAMRHRKAVYPPWAWPAGCTPSLFPARGLIPGELLLAVSSKGFLQIMITVKTFLPLELYSLL